MNKHAHALGEHLLQTVRGILYGFVFLFPLFFLPFTLDLLEVNKQTLLLLCVCIATLLWFGSILANKSLKIRLSYGWGPLTPLLFLFLFAISIAVSSYFSLVPFASWIGSSATEYSSVITIAALCLFFFLLTQTIATMRQYQNMFRFSLLGSVFAGAIAIFSIFHVSVFPFLHLSSSMMFNTVGTLNTLAVFLIVMCVFATGDSLSKSFSSPAKHALSGVEGGRSGGVWSRICTSSLAIILSLETFFILLALNEGWLWFLLVVGLVSTFTCLFARLKTSVPILRLFLPVAMTLLAILFWIGLPSPLAFKLPVEVSPSFQTSSDVLQKTLVGRTMIYGSGPGTYTFDFARYHGTNINQTNFWNTRFDRATSYILTLATESGIFGVVAFLLFATTLGVIAVVRFIREKDSVEALEHACVFCPWLTIVLASFVFPFNMTLLILCALLSGLLASRLVKREKTMTFAHSSFLAFGSSALFILFTLGLFLGIFLATQRYVAEIAYAQAIRSDRANVDVKILVSQLDRAATLNRFDDAAYRNLAEALILRVNDELKTASTNSPLDDASKKYIQSLVAAAVNAAVHATDLSPSNVTNWLVRGEVYRSLSSVVPHATDFSRDAYKRATQLEPNNPNHWTELGKTELIAADAAQSLTVSKDVKIADVSKRDMQSSLDQAQSAFEKAIALKSDFAPAHYQLGLVYEREGKLDLAIGKIESVATHNSSDVGVAFELGMLYLKRNAADDLNRAQNAFEHVIALTPSYSNAHWYLASIYEKQGKRDHAVKELEIVAKLNPGNQIVKARIDKLKSGVSTAIVPLPLDSQKK